MRTSFADVRAEMRDGLTTIRAAMREGFARRDAHLEVTAANLVKWVIGLVFASQTLTFGTVLFVLNRTPPQVTVVPGMQRPAEPETAASPPAPRRPSAPPAERQQPAPATAAGHPAGR
jgi:hypothetical protein